MHPSSCQNLVIRPWRLGSLLLRRAVVNVLADVGSIMELLSSVLDRVPNLSRGGRSTLGADEGVDASAELGERGLNMAALGEASAKEGSVEGKQDPRSSLEENGGEQEADPEEDLETRDNRHGGIVVLLHKGTNLVSKRVADRLGLGRGPRSFGDRLGSHNDGDQVGTGVGSDVEDGVDAIREESERILGREEPDKGHREILNVLIREDANVAAGRSGAGLGASALGLVDDNAVRQGSGNERKTVGELGDAAIVVHSQP